MAKAAAAEAGKKKKKKKADSKITAGKAKTKSGKDKRGKTKEPSGFETLARLANHPLVADLLAIGAMAAVAAVADHNFSAKSTTKAAGSKKAVKAAGKAAAAAIGQRILSEVASVKKPAKAG